MSDTTKVICAFWDGKCQAISTNDAQDIGQQIAEWLANGADIKKLPLEQAKDEFQKGMQRD